MAIIQHSHSWETLQFISPVLWLDWVAIYSLCHAFSPAIAIVVGIIGSCLYCVCFWLCIGYGSFGYGVRQYNVLNVPTACQMQWISYQTDPRRYQFVSLQTAIFACASLGMFIALLNLRDNLPHLQMHFEYWKDKSVKIDWEPAKHAHAYVAGLVLAPAIAGIVIAANNNRYDYLILGQDGCYASYVSGRWGYIDQDLVSWKVKVETWLGVNT
jgi:hypothetical protein